MSEHQVMEAMEFVLSNIICKILIYPIEQKNKMIFNK